MTTKVAEDSRNSKIEVKHVVEWQRHEHQLK